MKNRKLWRCGQLAGDGERSSLIRGRKSLAPVTVVAFGGSRQINRWLTGDSQENFPPPDRLQGKKGQVGKATETIPPAGEVCPPIVFEAMLVRRVFGIWSIITGTLGPSRDPEAEGPARKGALA